MKVRRLPEELARIGPRRSASPGACLACEAVLSRADIVRQTRRISALYIRIDWA